MISLLRDIILKTMITEVSGNDTLSLSYGTGPAATPFSTKGIYSASYFYDRALSTPVHLEPDFIMSNHLIKSELSREGK